MADLQTIRLMGTTAEMVERVNENFTEVETRKVDKELKTGSSTVYKVLSDNNLTDDQVTAITNNSAARHTHSNKSLLDTYSQTEAALASAVADDHTHSNKALLDTYNQTNANITSAISLKHSHANKDILDNTTASFTSDEKTKLAGIATGAEVNVQSDWDAVSGDAFIKNKPTSMPASDVSDWAKAATKPTYSASEVGADASGTASSAVSAHNSNATAHADIRTLANNAQTKADSAYNLAEGREKAVAYDTLTLARNALNTAASTTFKTGDNIFIKQLDVPDIWVYSVAGTQVTNSDTEADLIAKLNANVTVQIGYFNVSKLETNKVDLSGYVPTTRTVNGKALSANIALSASDVDALPETTKYGKTLGQSGRTVTLKDQDGTVLSTITTQDTTYEVATTSANGLMSSTDKTKLDGIATGATKVEDSTTNGNIKINGAEVNVYTAPVIDQVTELNFLSTDTWTTSGSNYVRTIASAKRPFVCYNSNGQVVMATLAYDGSNVTITSDTKFSGKVLVI